jgi:hypothetical protein
VIPVFQENPHSDCELQDTMQRFGVNYHRRIKMNSNSLKKLLAVAMTGLFLISVGASAGETKASCEKNGGKWDDTTHKCKKHK